MNVRFLVGDMTSIPHADDSSELPQFFSFLADLVQLYALNDQPSVLVLAGPGGSKGIVGIGEGRVLHAQCGERSGEEAFFHIMRWPSGQLKRRLLDRPAHTSISSGLSQLLLDAFFAFEEHGPLESEEPLDEELLHATQEIEIEPNQATELVTEERAAPPEHHGAALRHGRLLWGERLRKNLKGIKEVVSYDLIGADGEVPLRDTLVDEADGSQLAHELLDVLGRAHLLQSGVELMLTLPEQIHLLVQLPQDSYALHVVFDRAKVTLAMAHFKLTQAISSALSGEA